MTTENSDRSHLELAEILADELKTTKGIDVTNKSLDEVFKALHGAKLTALCFSGGGIRSATFGLGVVQALAKHKLLSQFDYLSTVSGGGYLGSWLSAWVCREHRKRPDPTDGDRDFGVRQVEENISCRTTPDAGDPNPEPSQLQHLREYSNYMSPKTGLLSADTWTLAAIYLRNLFLNLTIFLPLIAAVLMLPRFLFRVTLQSTLGPWPQIAALIAAVISGSWAIAFVISRLPSKTRDESVSDAATERRWFTAFMNTDAGVLLLGVIPLVLTAFLSSSLWAWSWRSGSELDSFGLFTLQFRNWIDPVLAYYLLVPIAAFVLGLIFFFILKFRQAPPDVPGAVAAFFSTIIGGLLLWAVSQRLFEPAWQWIFEMLGDERGSRLAWQIYQTLAVPVFLLIVLLAATAFIGFTSRPATDEDREWLARYGGWVLIVGGAWMIVNALVLFGPSALQWTLRFNWGDLFTKSGLPAIISGIVAAVSGVISLVGGFSDKSQVRDEPVKTKTSRFLSYAPKIAAVIFLGFIFVTIAYLTTALVGYFLTGSFDAYHATVLGMSSSKLLLATFAVLIVIGIGMAFFVNVNKFSLHGAYRDRLVRAYLGASNEDRKQNTFTGFDDSDNLELHELERQRPLHVINATVNLVGGENLAWQNRKAASFTMSALHCGSWAVKGYRRSRDYCRSTTTGKALRLGTAMAISGAAANPNMGYYSSAVVTFLMSLFNIRLGWWLGNTGERGSANHWFGLGKIPYYAKVGPSIAVLPLINETLGRTNERKRFLMVTDGGHFENLALYEMVLRRCRFIVLSDGAADADFKFGEIANAIQKCKVDLGVDIKFLGAMNIQSRYTKEEATIKRSRFAIAQITYPEKFVDPETKKAENHRGWLLYIRPTYYGTTEPRDVRYYAEANVQFPHQSTGDQMYDEKQFEAYRGLGFLTMEEVVGHAKTSPTNLIDVVKDELIALTKGDAELSRAVRQLFSLKSTPPTRIPPGAWF